MTNYQLTIELGNGSFSAIDDDLTALQTLFSRMGGEGSLVDLVKQNVGDLGKAATLSVQTQTSTTGNRATAQNQTASKSHASPVNDPWDDDVSGTQTARPSDEGDPWATDDPTETPAGAGGSRRSGGNAADASGLVKTKDDFGRTWTVGLPDAPICDCGEPAAKCNGRAQRTNKPYTVWKCAKATGSDWQDKCEFSEFPN